MRDLAARFLVSALSPGTTCPPAMSLRSHPSAALSTLFRAGGKPDECRSFFIRLFFDPPNFLSHASMHLLSHQVSAKLLLRLEPEWLRQPICLLIFRAQVLKSNDPVLDVVNQVVDTSREMLGASVSACLLGRQRDHRLIVFGDVSRACLCVSAEINQVSFPYSLLCTFYCDICFRLTC